MVDVMFDARATHFVPLAVLRGIAAGGSEPGSNMAYIGPEGVAAVKGAYWMIMVKISGAEVIVTQRWSL
jgi:hypothetical protein